MKLSAVANLPTSSGPFKIQSVKDEQGADHILIYTGELQGKQDIPVRIHSECMTSEVFGSLKCDCREQLEMAMLTIQERKSGLIIYLRQEGRGIGLFHKIEAYALQDKGRDTIQANEDLHLPVEARSYGLAVEILNYYGIHSVELMTNNPEKIQALEENGIRVSKQIPIRIAPNEFNQQYLEIKKLRMSHIL